MKRLKGKIAVVTGGASGIGKATSILFAQEGASLVIADNCEQLGEKAAEEISSGENEIMFIKTDVTKEADVLAVMDKAFSKHGKIDILFNSAGITGTLIESENLTEDEWDRVIDTNLKGVFLCTKNVIPFMRSSGGGSIINAASVLSYVDSPPSLAYNASKGGVVMVTKNFAVSYASENIRVNSICPGYIKTPLLEVLDEETITELVQATPNGRLGEPMEIARCVAFLASDDASYVTGTCFIVDGGFSCQCNGR